ncbi:hypothetical protein QJS10_CPB18g00567 [Acorus calamus]|uniref:Acetate--CoA ligase n=1 Tax=Acorus calamus TaxID=4465 RepID=A0AAV9CSA4_ACOCL|nr:hypothetical protein QJS10_CPB18g00567 [Acorus calamus]
MALHNTMMFPATQPPSDHSSIKPLSNPIALRSGPPRFGYPLRNPRQTMATSSLDRRLRHVESSAGRMQRLNAVVLGESIASEEDELVFPSEGFSEQALVSSHEQYLKMYKRSIEDPAGFWSEIASEFYWKTKWGEEVFTENLDVRKGKITIEWFKGATTNVCYNALDRNIEAGNETDLQDVVPKYSTTCEVEWMDAEDPLFLLYTSGSTGKPKGVLHTIGGYMIYTATTFKYAFDYKPSDVYWCTADCGWITGHSYVTYGPLLNGATVVVFEGAPTYPDYGRCWDIVDKFKVTILYTAPTLYVTRYSRKSLRILGSVGEPINPSAWRWLFNVVGDSRCPISDTWWQTETDHPSTRRLVTEAWVCNIPFFGVQPAIVDEKGNELEGECSGYLCIKNSWPGAFRTLYGDYERYETTYFKPFAGYYFSGDGCRRDKDGYYWLTGRVDDVINVSGHRIGTAEVESALVSHPQCAEAAVVGVEHEVKGQGIYAFVTLVDGVSYSQELRKSLVLAVRNQIGAFAAPDRIHWAPGLPKTRSGKIMRRILRKIASRQLDELGDTSTLADPSVVDQLIALSDF